jgi:two-component system response regulator FixJ
MPIGANQECHPVAGMTGTVLVVDDDAAVRSALKFLLEVEGLDVRLYDGASALLAEVSLPARGCLIIDHRMPDMDGLQLTDQLRARKVGLPVILIAGQVSDGLRRRAAKSGVRQVLEKPLSDGALVEGIRSVLATAA